MRRAVIYARYSTEHQNEKSCADQVAYCSNYCNREKLNVIGTYQDEAKSGASRFGRDGLETLMTKARAREFDVVVAEDFDRLSRNMSDLASMYQELAFLGIELHSVNDGVADVLKIGLRGMFGELYIRDVAKKVKRGMEAVARDGRYPGGRPYGYRVVVGEPGKLQIDPDQAAIVLRIFQKYAEGRCPRDIAQDLNRDNIPAPRRGLWKASTINGNLKRGTGILLCETYIGNIVWNKTTWVKDPSTGKRVSRPNPEEAWHTKEAPRLRIVSNELWEAVQNRKDARAKVHPSERRRPKHILSGLLKCAACGSGWSIHDYDKTGKARIRCSAVRESGSCRNRRIIYLPDVEEAVLSGMQEQLSKPALIQTYIDHYNKERSRLSATTNRDRPQLEAEIRSLQGEYDRAKALYLKGHISEEEVDGKLPALKEKIASIEAMLRNASQGFEPVSLRDDLAARYVWQIKSLAETLRGLCLENEQAVMNQFRSLVFQVTISPHGPRGDVDIDVTGRLTSLLSHPIAVGEDSGFRDSADLRYQSPISD